MDFRTKRQLNEILDFKVQESMARDLSDCDSDSDDEEMIAAILLEFALAPRMNLGPRLNLDDLSPLECELLFRFEKDDIKRLYQAMAIPPKYVCEQGTTVTGMEALMVLLRRLTYPNRLSDLTKCFGRSKTELSLIFNIILDDVYARYSHLLSSFDLIWLDKQAFAAAIEKRGAPLSTCIGFVDGTVRPTARPIVHQRMLFNGHKRVHCLKFQSLTTPNGLIAHLFGPMEGRRHDAFMLQESGLLVKLQPLVHPNGDPYVIYGDPAYGVSRNVISPFRGQLTQPEIEFNKAMSGVRVSVEWTFGKVTQLFAFLDFKKNLKILLQPVGKYYSVGVLLTNCHTCLYGSQTSNYFDVHPPCLEMYLSNI